MKQRTDGGACCLCSATARLAIADDCNSIGKMLLRDRVRASLAAMGEAPDYQRIAAEILGIRNAPRELARKLVAQALVVEDRREEWLRTGERVCAAAPAVPGVYVLRDAAGSALYVGKANNIRRRLRTHFASRRWRALKAEFTRAVDGEWVEVGSELEALLREAELIRRERPVANVQVGAPALTTRAVPPSLLRDTIVVARSVEADSAELIAARVDGSTFIQRTRRDGSDLPVHSRRIWRFFNGTPTGRRGAETSGGLAPIVFSWLAGRGAGATRLHPHDVTTPRALQEQLAVTLADAALFTERIVVLDSRSRRA
jgi:predicted GIY-YIG superfamily endonuclease